jgi:hypothetical protein
VKFDARVLGIPTHLGIARKLLPRDDAALESEKLQAAESALMQHVPHMRVQIAEFFQRPGECISHVRCDRFGFLLALQEYACFLNGTTVEEVLRENAYTDYLHMVAKMAPVGKLFDKVRLPEIARESGCHYVVNCTVSKPSLVEKVIRNAVHIAREIGPTYLQLYTPCILEIGKNSMEGLQEMRDSEKPTERFAYKEYVSEPAKQLLAELAAKDKERKAAAKQLAGQASA